MTMRKRVVKKQPVVQKVSKDKHLNTFIGQKVDLYTKLKIEQSESQDNVSMTQITPLILSGILVDFDKIDYFLGDDTGEILEIVKRSDIIAVRLDKSVEDGGELPPVRTDMN